MKLIIQHSDISKTSTYKLWSGLDKEVNSNLKVRSTALLAIGSILEQQIC